MKKEVKIGIFGLVMLFALYWGISFLMGRDLFAMNRTYYAYYDSVNGIQITSPIMIKGISIGSVTRITFKPELDNQIEVQMSVKPGYKIPDNSIARIASTSIIGGKAIEIEFGDATSYLQDDATIASADEESLFAMAGSELDHFKQKLNTILSGLESTVDGINAIIGDDGGSVKGAMVNIEEITATFDKTLKAKVNGLEKAIDGLTEFSMMLASSSGRVESMITNIDQFSGSLAEVNVAGMVDKLNFTIEGINNIIHSTDGTLGLLLNDTALYDSLTAASSNLTTLLADIEADPKRYVHFSLFGRKNK